MQYYIKIIIASHLSKKCCQNYLLKDKLSSISINIDS